MKKLLFTALLASSSLMFAKNEIAIVENKNPDVKELVADKHVNKLDAQELLSSKMPPNTLFEDCVLHNSISLSVSFILAGIPVDGELITVFASLQCAQVLDYELKSQPQ